MSTEPFRCPWCLETAVSITTPCSCCGLSTNRATDGSCQHRTGETLNALFGRGVRLVRRDPWSEYSYIELVEIGGFLGPWGKLHSPLELTGVPPEVAMAVRSIGLWQLPQGGWEPYLGVTVEEQGATDV